MDICKPSGVTPGGGNNTAIIRCIAKCGNTPSSSAWCRLRICCRLFANASGKDLKLPGSPKEKVLAAIVRLLETSCIRIGNDDYARENDYFGLTTLRNKHVRVRGSKIQFHFRGKSGQIHDIELEDPKLAKIVGRCQCISGQELFQYLDGERSCRITSDDVNEYLRSTTGEYFTAKDFRTWV